MTTAESKYDPDDHTSSYASVCSEKGRYEGVHEPGVNVPCGRPETDGVQLLSLPLNSARLEDGFDLTVTTLDDVLS